MEKDLFRNWDNVYKFIKSQYQQAPAKIGHLEYLYDTLKNGTLADWAEQEDGYTTGEIVFDGDGLYRNTIDGNTTQPSVDSPDNGWELIINTAPTLQDVTENGSVSDQDVTFASVSNSNGEIKPYKSYVINLTQPGDNTAPSITYTNENNIGSIVWTRNNSGRYTGTLAGAFPANKTRCFINLFVGEVNTEEIATLFRADNDRVSLNVYESGISFVDGFVADIEIRVYN